MSATRDNMSQYTKKGKKNQTKKKIRRYLYSVATVIFPEIESRKQIMKDFNNCGANIYGTTKPRETDKKSDTCNSKNLVNINENNSCSVCYNIIPDRYTAYKCYNDFTFCESCKCEKEAMGYQQFVSLAFL